MLVYRITKSKRATDISGTGAALNPGRWNKRGTPVLYTSENPETALLENIIHLPPMLIPKLDILTIEVPDDSLTVLDISELPANWAQYPAPTILSEIGQQWVNAAETVGLQVPSCIIHSSHYILLNCAHRNYHAHVKILDQKPFHFDTRLRKW